MGKKKSHKKKGGGPRLRKDLYPREEKEDLVMKQFWSWTIVSAVCLICFITFFVYLNGGNYFRRQGMLTFDEGIYSQLGMRLKEGKSYSTQEIYETAAKQGRKLPPYLKSPVFHHPPMYAWLSGMSFFFLEKKDNYTSQELYSSTIKLSHLAGCLLIFLIFFIGRKFYGEGVGLIAALLLSCEFNLMNCSTKVWIDATLALIVWFTLYLLYKSTKESKYFYAAGVMTAIALLTKYPAVLIFPIFIGYALFYARHIFRQKEFYIFLGISALIFSPWIFYNIHAFGGENMLKGMFAKTASYVPRYKKYGIFALIAFFIILGGALFHQKQKKAQAAIPNTIRWVGSGIIGALLLFLLAHADFRTSIFSSLKWEPSILLGWKMGLYDDQPWYFYIKQHIEYSPLYLLFFISLIRLPFGKKEDHYLFFAVFWFLTFGILWKNPQGRYVICFVPAAILLTAKYIWDYLVWLKSRDYGQAWIKWLVLIVFHAVLLYAYAKSWHVDITYALSGSYAYY